MDFAKKSNHIAANGIEAMREYHSKEGLEPDTAEILESLGEVGVVTLNGRFNEADKKDFIMVLLRSAFQVGRTKFNEQVAKN